MWSGANIWIITTVCGTSSTVSMLFAIKGFVSKKCRKATHKSKKLLKKKTWISTERLITVSIFIWRMQPVLQQLLHMDKMQRLSALALHF